MQKGEKVSVACDNCGKPESDHVQGRHCWASSAEEFAPSESRVEEAVKLTKAQKSWASLYSLETGYPPTLRTDAPTFDEFAWANINWFEAWSKDVMNQISNPPTTEEEP